MKLKFANYTKENKNKFSRFVSERHSRLRGRVFPTAFLHSFTSPFFAVAVLKPTLIGHDPVGHKALPLASPKSVSPTQYQLCNFKVRSIKGCLVRTKRHNDPGGLGPKRRRCRVWQRILVLWTTTALHDGLGITINSTSTASSMRIQMGRPGVAGGRVK